jgi:hypothetical protein
MASSKNSIYKFFYALAALFLIAYIFTTVQDIYNWAGWMLAASLLSIALAFRGH